MAVPISSKLLAYAEAALIRMQYLHPDVSFSLNNDGVELAAAPSVDLQQIGREIRYALYRERIYAETLPTRRALVEVLTRP